MEENFHLQHTIVFKSYLFGLHDNYHVECDNTPYILRLYRNEWRTRTEALFELELLDYLRARSSPVAAPVLTKEGQLYFIVPDAQGERVAALFTYAKGYPVVRPISEQVSSKFGQVIGQLHESSAQFVCSQQRPLLDLPYLLDESLAAIEEFVDVQGMDYLRTIQSRLQRVIPELPRDAPAWGICMGDVNLNNFHINDDGDITLFDFDQCGFGFRAFEIGKFASSLPRDSQKMSLLNAFLAGYRQVRGLTEQELSAIPWYEVVSVVWVMAIHARNSARIGQKYLSKFFWDRKLALLRSLEVTLSEFG